MLNTDPIEPVSYEPHRTPREPDDHDSFDGDAVIRFVRRRGRICAFGLVAGLLAGITYATVMPRHYTAVANVLLDEGAANAGNAGGSGADATNTTYLETQVQVLESNEVLGRAVDTIRLADDDEFGRTAGDLHAFLSHTVRSLLGYGTPTVEPRYATIVRVRHGLSVLRLGMSNVLEIRFTSRSPVRSATIANAIIQSYIDGRLMAQRKERAAAASHLRERLAELQDKAFPADPPQDAPPQGAPPQGAPPQGAPTVASEARSQARAHFREQQDQIQTYRELYDRLLQRAYGEPEGQSASVNVQVITPAEPIFTPSSQIVVVLVFTAIGGAAGFGYALIKQATDHRLSTVEDVQRSTGADRVVAVPTVKPDVWTTEKSLPAYLQPAYLKVATPLYDAVSKLAVRLRDGQIRRTGWIIGVATSTDGAGTSTVAVHLARIMAESGQKTLLLDANWRKPSTGQALLNASPSRKLARGLATIHLEAECLDVFMLRATTPVSELNASLSIVSTLELLRADYDCIVIDFHSGAQTADLQACIAFTDDVVVVAEARRTTSESLCGFLRELPGNKIATVILNKVQSRMP